MEQKINLLKEYAQRLDIHLDSVQIERLLAYAQLIKEWNRKVHLISKNDVERIVERHIIPSLFFEKYLSRFSEYGVLRIMDVGTGAGFPGIVLAIVEPRWKLVLLDSSRKKTLFLRRVCAELEIEAQVVCERYEKFVEESRDDFEWIVARAVAPLGELITLVRPHLERGVRLLTIKGLDFMNELDGALLEEFRLSAWRFDKDIMIEDYLKNKCLVKVEMLYG
ncbi:16S rRNA (guanine(527)-N(7))-methyltransferase RsmG [Caldithrix abyssi]